MCGASGDCRGGTNVAMSADARAVDEAGTGSRAERPRFASDWRLDRLPDLIPRRVERVLLVASAYDSFMLDEYGLLSELIHNEYAELGLTHAPEVAHVTTGREALDAVQRGVFDLVITTRRPGGMDVAQLGAALRQVRPGMPIVLLIGNVAELADVGQPGHMLNMDSVYVWHGDSKLFLAIIKSIEDRWNVEHDTREAGVGVIILLEDSRRYRSSLLPIMYAALVTQTRSVMADGINHMHKLMRMRARPKLLVSETFEQGIEDFERYRDNLFGVVADVRFPRAGVHDPTAGIEFISHVKRELPDLPALLQSSEPGNRSLAESIGAHFLHKRSTTLLQDVNEFMLHNFGFGDFVFRLPDGTEVARARDLRQMCRVLADVPAVAVEYHAARNHFSNWLRARTEFDLARQLRPKRVSDFSNPEELRGFLVGSFREVIRRNRRGMIEDFARERFDEGTQIARIGGGSLGGKARGLAFVDALLARHVGAADFADVRVFVPSSAVLGTDVFDEFLDGNRLRIQALQIDSDEYLRWAFRLAELPARVREDLGAYLASVREPLAVRSSSLLEDSEHYPLAGVYATHMLPNNHPDLDVRLAQLCDAIKLVYASTFCSAARRYLEATPHRIEEEKMGVILQPLVGLAHEGFFYPNLAGVALSHNFYPFGQMKPDEGVATVALGLGTTVVDGGQALRFCPSHPQSLPQLANGREFIDRSQRAFYALDLNCSGALPSLAQQQPVVRLELEDAERHGTLAPVGSVWSQESDCFFDGIYRPGVRVVTLAHVLKADLFPLAAILQRLLELGRMGMNGPVEIEFAANFQRGRREFAVLQMRPCAGEVARGRIEFGSIDPNAVLCECPQALGHGRIEGVCDVVYVRPEAFDPGRTNEIAREVHAMNESVRASGRHCLLIGPGRWGSSNRSLGVPVTWAQISTARAIVETTLDNFSVDPSQGSHFFHNLTSMGIAYLTVNPRIERGFIDWRWLNGQPVAHQTDLVRHVRLDAPLEILVDGLASRAIILKRERPPQ